MSEAITRKSMAQALSVVGEASADGLEYNSAVNALAGELYASRKGRWTLAKSPAFTPAEFRVHMALAVREGFVDAGAHNDRVANGEYGCEPWTLFLTLKGWEHIELYDQPLIHRWAYNLRENLPTVVFSIASAILVAYVIKTWGLN